MNVEEIRKLCTGKTVFITAHLRLRMRERGIRYSEIMEALQSGEVIEDYPTDYPYPSCLLLSNGLHVVCSIGEEKLFVITAYRPSSGKWEADERTRKEQAE